MNSRSGPVSRRRAIIALLLLVCPVVAATSALLAWRWFAVVREQLHVPWDVEWETPNLCSILTIQRHIDPYADSTYNAPPFVLTAYTPLYHYLASLFPVDEANPFFYGRLISLAAFLALATFIACYNKICRLSPVGWLLALAFLSTWPVTSYSAYLKNDSLGILLAVAGMLLVARCTSWWTLTAAALLAVAALATKQSILAATVAAAAFLLARDQRACVLYLVGLVLWGGLAAAYASAHYGAGFWLSTIQAQRQPFDFVTGEWALRQGYSQPLVDVLVLTAAAVVCRRLYADGLKRTMQASPAPAYFALATLQCLLTCWKGGASINYLFEPLLAACFVLADAARGIRPGERWPKFAVLVATCLLLAGVYDLGFARITDYNRFTSESARASREGRIAEYRQMLWISGFTKPRILNTATHLTMFTTGLEPSFNDPWLYRSLWGNKTLTLDPLIAAIERREYDVIIMPEPYGSWGRERTYLPADCFLFRFRGALPEMDLRLRGLLAGKYRPYAVSPQGGYTFFVRERE